MRSVKIPSWLPLALVLFVALLVRLPLLSGSFWLDEAAQALESARPLSQQLQIRDDFQPPLLHFLIHFALYISDSEWWLRTIGALIPGLVTVFFTYKIGVTIKDKKSAIMATLLLATSSFHIFYSQELRQYSLPAALATISWFILIRAWKVPAKPTWQILLIFVIIQAAGLYSSYLYPFAIIGQATWLLYLRSKHMVLWLGAFFVSALLFVPWVPFFLDQLSAGTTLRSALPGWETTVSPTQWRALPLLVSKFIYGVADVEPNVMFISLTCLVTFQIAAIFLAKKFKKSDLYEVSPIIFWLFVPIITAWLVSFWVPVLQPKRVLFSLPSFYLLIAFISFHLTHKIRTFSLFTSLPVLVSTFFLINLVTLTQYWSSPLLQRENWRELVVEIERKYPESSVAVFSFPEPFAPWRWYAPDSPPAISTQQLLLDEATAIAIIKQATQYDFIITFDYLRDLTDPDHLLNKQLFAYGYKEIEVIDYPVIGFVRIYSRPEAVISYK